MSDGTWIRVHQCPLPRLAVALSQSIPATARVGDVWTCSCGEQYVLKSRKSVPYWKRKRRKMKLKKVITRKEGSDGEMA